MLDANQAAILKVDLHFTHKDEEVLNLMQIHNIYALFVPASCTDIYKNVIQLLTNHLKMDSKSGISGPYASSV
jgi:hypothetical protein